MKIENLVEKDTVLDDDYLIVDGTDGTKRAKKSNFLSELNSSYGVNENGSYLRLPDGTQICWLNISVTDQAISDPYSDILYTGSRIWTFPMPFISSPAVSCGIFKWGSSASWGSLSSQSSSSTVTLRGYDIIPREAGTTCLIQAIAIGRWKS